VKCSWPVSAPAILTIVVLLVQPVGSYSLAPSAWRTDSEHALFVADSGGEQLVLEVCSRPLPRWAGSRNIFLRIVNRLVFHHLHHTYIHFVSEVFIPTLGASVHTMGIHPIGPANTDKQPLPDQVTDEAENEGQCKIVKDATPEKVKRLTDEIAAGVCHSCGQEYHNRVLMGCYNNSNTYVYDLISGAGMTPPRLRGVPGYHHHRRCM
jgi:hypothetical protein